MLLSQRPGVLSSAHSWGPQTPVTAVLGYPTVSPDLCQWCMWCACIHKIFKSLFMKIFFNDLCPKYDHLRSNFLIIQAHTHPIYARCRNKKSERTAVSSIKQTPATMFRPPQSITGFKSFHVVHTQHVLLHLLGLLSFLPLFSLHFLLLVVFVLAFFFFWGSLNTVCAHTCCTKAHILRSEGTLSSVWVLGMELRSSGWEGSAFPGWAIDQLLSDVCEYLDLLS